MLRRHEVKKGVGGKQDKLSAKDPSPHQSTKKNEKGGRKDRLCTSESGREQKTRRTLHERTGASLFVSVYSLFVCVCVCEGEGGYHTHTHTHTLQWGAWRRKCQGDEGRKEMRDERRPLKRRVQPTLRRGRGQHEIRRDKHKEYAHAQRKEPPNTPFRDTHTHTSKSIEDEGVC